MIIVTLMFIISQVDVLPSENQVLHKLDLYCYCYNHLNRDLLLRDIQ